MLRSVTSRFSGCCLLIDGFLLLQSDSIFFHQVHWRMVAVAPRLMTRRVLRLEGLQICGVVGPPALRERRLLNHHTLQLAGQLQNNLYSTMLHGHGGGPRPSWPSGRPSLRTSGGAAGSLTLSRWSARSCGAARVAVAVSRRHLMRL